MPSLPGVSPRKITAPQQAFVVRIDKKLHRELATAAFETGMSMSALVEMAIDEYLHPEKT